jgi:hypothetical protein
MPGQPSRYRSENGVSLIEIELESVSQLFNSFDPSPFHLKDLDVDAEAWIVGAVRDFALATPLKLVLHLPPDELGRAEEAGLARALASYFGDRLESTRRDLRYLFRTGRIALLIGLAFLGACLGLRALAQSLTGPLATLVTEGLLILGWVALWRPAEIFLYDWWPLRRMGRVYAKIAAMPVELRGR